jgi:hypothetical protein
MVLVVVLSARVSSFFLPKVSYCHNKGLLKSETIEPNTKKALTTTYNYD